MNRAQVRDGSGNEPARAGARCARGAEPVAPTQLHLSETDVRPPTINATVTALRFFFKVTLDRPETTRHLDFVYEPRKLPRVLTPEEVLRLLEAAPGPKHKAALSVAYGARPTPVRTAASAPP
jgi:integrase